MQKTGLSEEEMKEYTVTVDGLLTRAMSVMGEESKYKSGYRPFVVSLANQILMDCFEVNNTIRASMGKQPLMAAPEAASENDVIPYEYEVTTNILPYGLAFWLLYQDDEYDKANVCNSMYEAGKEKFGRAAYEDVENAYR